MNQPLNLKHKGEQTLPGSYQTHKARKNPNYVKPVEFFCRCYSFNFPTQQALHRLYKGQGGEVSDPFSDSQV